MNSFVRLYETSAVVLTRWNCMPDAHAVSLAAMRSASMIVVTFVGFHPCRDETASRGVTPTVVLVRWGVGGKGHTPLTARDEIEFPSLPLLRILKEFIKRRVAAFLEVLIRLQPATSSLLASVVDSDGYFCTFNHARRLNAFMQMQNTFAGIKPYCDVCNPITQTMRLLTPETTRPVHIFLPTRIVATTVRKQDR
jgi:hypothetical protein